MNAGLTIAAILVLIALGVWFLTRLTAQQREGAEPHRLGERRRRMPAVRRSHASRTPEMPWLDHDGPRSPSPPGAQFHGEAGDDGDDARPGAAHDDAPTAPDALPEHPAAEGDRRVEPVGGGSGGSSGGGVGPPRGTAGRRAST